MNEVKKILPVKNIKLRGVRQNNLKNIDIDIPLGSFTVVCGPSGSGKSSLAFETLYAEGQRRYIESLSSYARQFLNKSPQPDLDDIENIPPAIAIEQKNTVKTSRSTVGTVTEVIDFLRLLFEKLGIPFCPNGHGIIKSESVSSSVDHLIRDFDGERGYILAPITAEGRVAEGKKLLSLLIQEGFIRIFYKKEMKEINAKTNLPKEDFFLVIDRTSFSKDERGRIADSLNQAYSASKRLNKNYTGGHARVQALSGKELKFSEEMSCNECEFTFPPISSRLFNFSSPIGACSNCNGFGNTLDLDERKIIPNPTKSLIEGCIHPFAMPSATQDRKELKKFCTKYDIDMNVAWEDLPAKQRKMIWDGTKEFYGVKGLFTWLETKKYKMHVRVFLARFKSAEICKVCKGTRLKPEVQHILIHEKSITDMSQMTVEDLLELLKSLTLTKQQKETTAEVLKQLIARLGFMMDVGVNYLSMDRPTRTLSGGEYQRINLANQLGMGLSQTLYVLDEPTVGLHPSDNDRLIKILKDLKNLGNTLVVVEHDKEVIRESDRVIEMGPGSGHLGGEVLFQGTKLDFLEKKDSLTAHYLRDEQSKKVIINPRPVDLDSYKYKIELQGCKGHNLKNVDATFPLRRFVVITGVSGSGKSSLISQTLYPAIEQNITGERQEILEYKKISGIDEISNVIFIDQKPIGKSSRSNPASYMKVFDEIRNIFSSTDDAKERGLTPGYFSLNVEGGRCPDCNGEGHQVIDMAFMDDVILTCETCEGKRYRKEALDIEYRGKSINDVLNMTVLEAMNFFVNYPQIRRSLMYLKEVGLDYLRLGQSAPTLSGGESQRLKIAKELTKSQQNNTLYILDEPTTGLHPREIEFLLQVLNKLIDAGGSVIVIEHNIDVIKQADFVIEIGPQGGKKGGKILFAGAPEDLSKKKNCPTAPYLKPYFER
ncbi:MAG: excinuclease ABC subunit UvrA [Bdellovibrionota bacterium]